MRKWFLRLMAGGVVLGLAWVLWWGRSSPEAPRSVQTFAEALTGIPDWRVMPDYNVGFEQVSFLKRRGIGQGELTEVEARELFSNYTSEEIPPHAKMTRTLYHYRRPSGDTYWRSRGTHAVEFTLPPEEARALFEKVAAVWKSRHEVNLSDENGEEIFQHPGGYNFGRTQVNGDAFAGLAYLLPNHETREMWIYLMFNPKTGEMKFHHTYGRSSS
jgi:hypothetical protein